jgi:hypothetical protein
MLSGAVKRTNWLTYASSHGVPSVSGEEGMNNMIVQLGGMNRLADHRCSICAE